MRRPYVVMVAFLAFIALFLSAVYASPATVTNEGNFTVRIQYKTPDSPYQDIYVKPGETVSVPGGVEKVKVVREIGEWGGPLRPGQTLRVVVKEGDQTAGVLTWFGDKAFFSQLTEGAPPPPVQINNQPPLVEETPQPETPANEPPPTSTGTETKPDSSEQAQTHEGIPWWPWFGGIDGWLLFPMLMLMMLPFILGLGRSFIWPRFANGPLYPGPRWDFIILMVGLGLLLSGWGIFGYGHYHENGGGSFDDDEGFFPFFARDLFWFPLFLALKCSRLFGIPGTWFLSGAMPQILILTFWMTTCTGLGRLVGLMRAPWLYGLLTLLAVPPFLVFLLGLNGANAYSGFSEYSEMPLYSGAFSSLFIIPLLFLMLLQFQRPYGGWREAPLGGGCLTPGIGLCLGLVLSGFTLWGWNHNGPHTPFYPLFYGLASLPLMSGFQDFGWLACLFLFWPFLFGLCGWGLGRCGLNNLVWLSAFPALIGLLFFNATFYIGDDMRMSERMFWARERVFYEMGMESAYDYDDDGKPLPPEAFGDDIDPAKTMRALSDLGREIMMESNGNYPDRDQYRNDS